MKDKDCLFCKIASGELPSATLYEDEDSGLFLIWDRHQKAML